MCGEGYICTKQTTSEKGKYSNFTAKLFWFILPIVHDKNYPILLKLSGGHSINQPFNLLKQTILIHNSKRNIYYCDYVRIRYSSP